MATADVAILDGILAKRRAEFATGLSDDRYFEQFSSNEVLRRYDLSYSELEDGNVGGGTDGGLDGLYTFVNGEYVTEDFDFTAIGPHPEIDFWAIQSKRSSGFGETAIDRATNTFKDLLDFEKNTDDLARLYDSAFASSAERFRKAVTDLAAKYPATTITYVFVTKGDREEIGEPVTNRAEALRKSIEQDLRHSTVHITFVGAQELLDLARSDKTYSLTLSFAEQFVSTGSDNYLGLVKLRDLLAFVVDETSELRRYVFEANVRDFQGTGLEVNKDISASLSDAADSLDFWWLNNGVTVLGSNATSAGKRVTIRDAQVVNGLQTTYALHELSKADPQRFAADERSVLVKVIVTDEIAARDRIIKATNFQTPIQPASLRATDRYQRNIEDYLKQHNWYYDRRKNQYKNQGKQRDRIVSIGYLAQAVMSIVYREPDQARARPSTLIKNEEQYQKLFRQENDLELYLFCVELMKCVDDFLIQHGQEYSPFLRTNIRFHVSMACIAKLIGQVPYGPHEVAKRVSRRCDGAIASGAASEVRRLLDEFVGEKHWPIERACKSHDFVEFIENGLQL